MGLTAGRLKYEIFHIKGEENRLADLGSRWGNRYAAAKAKPMDGLSGGPRPLMLRVLRTKAPRVSDEVTGRDLDTGKIGLLPLNANTVTREDLAMYPEKYASSRPTGLKQSRESPSSAWTILTSATQRQGLCMSLCWLTDSLAW